MKRGRESVVETTFDLNDKKFISELEAMSGKKYKKLDNKIISRHSSGHICNLVNWDYEYTVNNNIGNSGRKCTKCQRKLNCSRVCCDYQMCCICWKKHCGSKWDYQLSACANKKCDDLKIPFEERYLINQYNIETKLPGFSSAARYSHIAPSRRSLEAEANEPKGEERELIGEELSEESSQTNDEDTSDSDNDRAMDYNDDNLSQFIEYKNDNEAEDEESFNDNGESFEDDSSDATCENDSHEIDKQNIVNEPRRAPKRNTKNMESQLIPAPPSPDLTD